MDPTTDLIYKIFALIIILLCVILVVVFIILVHTLPEKIAERRKHPQKDAIKCMGILGLIMIPLWFFAMIWAYTQPKLTLNLSKTRKAHIEVDDESAQEPETNDNSQTEN